MATNLLDIIQKNRNAMLNPASQAGQAAGLAPTAGETTQQVGDLLRTGQTGKEQLPSSGPKASALTEKLAAQQTGQQLEALGQEAELQDAEAEQQAEIQRRAATIENEALENKRQETVDNFNRQTNAILQNYRQQERELDLNKDKARVEAMGFQLRLGNQDYIRRLQAEGQKNRLLTQAGMNEAIARSVFADEQELFADDMMFRSLMGDKNRDFLQQMSNIDINTALAIASAENKQANQTSMWSGVGNLAGAGVQALATSSPSKDPGVPDSTQVGGTGDWQSGNSDEGIA